MLHSVGGARANPARRRRASSAPAPAAQSGRRAPGVRTESVPGALAHARTRRASPGPGGHKGGGGALIWAACICANCSNIWHSFSYMKTTGTTRTMQPVAAVHTMLPPSHHAFEPSFISRLFAFLTLGADASAKLDSVLPIGSPATSG